MSEAAALALALAGGALLGAFYFGTLWLVVRRLDRLPGPGVWLGITGLVRLVVVVILFVRLIDGRWERLVAALAGFVAVRVALTRRLGRPEPAARGRASGRRGA